MGKARREVPEITLLHIGHLWTSILVQNCHAAVAVSHDRPFRLLVPMKLTTPPGPSRMLTPAIVVEILKSSWVICRAQPPFWIRLGARLNDVQNCGMPLTSVAGG